MLSAGKFAIVNGKVYYGGGFADRINDIAVVSCYDPSQDNWSTLPPLPVGYFGLGQVNGKLVAVGGMRMSDDRTTNDVYTYDERSKKWKLTIPPMPTARASLSVLSLQSALIVAGGITSIYMYTDAIEIFKRDTSQWYTTDPLPTARRNISLVAIGNTCYALGGYRDGLYFNQALYASVDDLLCNANQMTHSITQSAWKTLPDTPTYQPTAAVLAGQLLALGGNGREQSLIIGNAFMKKVYVYSPSTNSWIYISDLPTPQLAAGVAVLSPTEMLVTGGWCGVRVDTVCKGTLHLNV